jgi:hypothetical protein
MLGNAALLSAVYLAVGAIVEGTRRLYRLRWLERASLAMDSMPARFLEAIGVMPYLQELYAHDRISEFWIRVTFGAVAVLIIFLIGILVGAGMWLARRLLQLRWARR